MLKKTEVNFLKQFLNRFYMEHTFKLALLLLLLLSLLYILIFYYIRELKEFFVCDQSHPFEEA